LVDSCKIEKSTENVIIWQFLIWDFPNTISEGCSCSNRSV